MPYTERVLYVDDDALCRRSFAREMRQCGFIVDVAESGEEALSLAQHYPYAVLAADWRMPGLDGLRLVEEVRGSETEPVCVLITGANESDIDQREVERLGIRSVVRKPWASEQLAQALSQALDAFHVQQERVQDSLLMLPKTTRILLIERDEHCASQLTELLKDTPRSDFELFRVSNMNDALQVLESEDFQAVLVSLDLPDIPGVETVQRILSCSAKAPILTLASSDDDNLSLAAVRAGAQDFLLKGQLDRALLTRSIQHAIERKRSEDRLAYIAHHDQLTDLANRTLLSERLNQAIARAKRKRAQVAVFFLDLDRFKGVNDTLGHDAGDQLLQQVSQRLRGSVRNTDTVARLGGDEFAIVLEELERSEEATLLAGRVLNSFATPFRLQAGEVITTTSIGIAMYPHNGGDVDELLKCADSAMYRAKQTGRDNYQFFSEELHAQAVRQVELESALRTAVEENDFEVHYQPQVSCQLGHLVGVEALVRWRHPTGTLAAPKDFIPLMEETGLIVPLGEWVLKKACAQVKAWNTSSDLNLRLCVNISARQFEDPGFVRSVQQALIEHQIPGPQLELEVTESVLRHAERTIHIFEELRSLGVRIAIDDFGTGHSSLAYLQSFPIDALKIDRSFLVNVGQMQPPVSGIPPAPEASQVSASPQAPLRGEPRAVSMVPPTSKYYADQGAALASAVIALGRSLGLDVIAEGVENEAQLQFLQRQECDSLQGHLVGRPRSAAKTTEWLRHLVNNGNRWSREQAEPSLPSSSSSSAA